MSGTIGPPTVPLAICCPYVVPRFDATGDVHCKPGASNVTCVDRVIVLLPGCIRSDCCTPANPPRPGSYDAETTATRNPSRGTWAPKFIPFRTRPFWSPPIPNAEMLSDPSMFGVTEIPGSVAMSAERSPVTSPLRPLDAL